MPVSDKDKAFMKQVADYFSNTKTPDKPEGSINTTAKHFKINRNKVRKILVTMGVWKSPLSEEVMQLRNRGMSIQEIAAELGVSVATVSTALPYEDKVDNTLEPSEHTSAVREYRAYEKKQKDRQAGHVADNAVPDTWKGDTMAEAKENIIEKEWQKDIKMSYTETYHRPHRMTWADREEERAELEGHLSEDHSEEMQKLMQAIKELEKEFRENEKQYKKLSEKKNLTAGEKEKLRDLSYKTGNYPGALDSRNKEALEKISGDRLPPEPVRTIRLHMELFDEYEEWYDGCNDKYAEVFRKYGKLEYGDHISRDIIVPGDIPLYALHYVIQRAFGWENSHLHRFELPKEQFKMITDNNASTWSYMVGVYLRSPLMNEDDEFWADDYNGGSFKNWLRKKYTGPYLSQCYGEGLMSCQRDMLKIDMDEKYYVLYEKSYNRKTQKYDGEERITEVIPVYDHNGKKRSKPKPIGKDDRPYRVETKKFEAIPAEGLTHLFDRDPMALLERLPIDSVLAPAEYRLLKDVSGEEREYIDEQIAKSAEEVAQELGGYVCRIVKEQIDSPMAQVYPIPVTDTLIYSYDFGDNWKIRITASENCVDLVESGRITQAELDRANVKCREVYRPVLIARDGEMLVDDVGGIHGFAEFLKEINPDLKGLDPEEKEEAKQRKKDNITWAKSLGWHRENLTDFNLL